MPLCCADPEVCYRHRLFINLRIGAVSGLPVPGVHGRGVWRGGGGLRVREGA